MRPGMSEFLSGNQWWKFRWWKRNYSIILVVLFALLLRLWAVWQLPMDADEPVYLKAGNDYAEFIKAGDVREIINYEYNREHPALVKLLYSIPYMFIDSTFGSNLDLTINRLQSVLFGVGSVFLLATIDPLAGLFLAFHTMTIKYTSEVYLESLPLLAILGCVFAFRKVQRGQMKWLWISAALLGVAGASKYTYLMIVMTLAYLWIKDKGIPWKYLVAFTVLSVSVFYILNPTLWTDPFHRFLDAFLFHASYSQSIAVQTAKYPWYQPILWISNEVPWHPQVFFFFGSDIFIFWLTILGFQKSWKDQPWTLFWFISCLAILLVWPTKWPQYSLILTVPMCLISSHFIRNAIEWAVRKESYWDYLKEMLPVPPKAFWIILILLTVAVITGKVNYEVQMAMLRRGWMSIAEVVTPLPSNSVRDIQIGQDGSVVLATSNGVAMWIPDGSSPWGDQPVWYSSSNSGLPGNDVYAIHQDESGNWWVGTSDGLGVFDGSNWTKYRSADYGLAAAKILTIAEESNGAIWIGTVTGASRWDGVEWKAYTSENSLMDDAVYAIEIEPTVQGDIVWFGQNGGISKFNQESNQWSYDQFSSLDIDPGGITVMYHDSQDRMLVGTVSGGLGIWENEQWTFFRASNSPIPLNHITAIHESAPGQYWLGLAYPSEPGGILAYFSDGEWIQYTTKNSGFLGSEPTAIVQDDQGRVWIGMAANGVNIFDVNKQSMEEKK